jgi:hypothetical protein
MKALEFLVSVPARLTMGSGGSVQFQLTAEEAVDKKCAVKSTPGAMTTRSARPKTCFSCKHDVRRKRCYPKKCPEMHNLITLAHAGAIVWVFFPKNCG